MRFTALIFSLFFTFAAFAQTDRGTVTGTVSDPVPQPSVAGFTANPTISPATGLYTGGFGTIVPTSGTSGQRSGTIVGPIQF